MSAVIDENRATFGVQPICETLGVSASAFYHRASGAKSARVLEDERVLALIRVIHAEKYEAYGYRRVWKEARRRGHAGVPRWSGAAADGRARHPRRQAPRQAVAHDGR